MFARCLENRVFAVTTNRYGTEELAEQRLTFTGASQIMTPRGERLSQAPIEGDCVAVVEIDPAAADDKHVTAANDLFADRRPEMYGLEHRSGNSAVCFEVSCRRAAFLRRHQWPALNVRDVLRGAAPR